MAGSGSVHLIEESGLNAVHETSNVILMGDKRCQLQPTHRLAHIGVGIAERLERPPRLNAELVLERVFEFVLAHHLQSAVGVMEQDDLSGPHESLGKTQRSDDVVGDDTAGVTNDVGFAVPEPEDFKGVHAGVHTGHDRNPSAWCNLKVSIIEAGCVLAVVRQELIGVRLEIFIGHMLSLAHSLVGDVLGARWSAVIWSSRP